MRLMHVNATAAEGSTGRLCADMTAWMRSRGHEVAIAYSSGAPVEGGFLMGNRLDHKMHALSSRITGLQAYSSRAATEEMLQHVGRFAPNVVHLHNLHSNYIHLPRLLSYLAEKDIPTVLTLHDCWFYTGKCTHYTAVNCSRWTTGCGNCPQLRSDVPSWWLDRTRRMLADKARLFAAVPRLGVVGVSEWITGEANRSILGCATIMATIYNWVNGELFQPVDAEPLRSRMGLDGKRVVLMAAAKWSHAKGWDRLPQVARRLPDSARLLVVGAIDRPQPRLSNVIWVGPVVRPSELAAYYSLADVFVNVSRQESFGLVAAEALACGTPVVTFDETANPEIVGPRCGHVAPRDNFDLLMQGVGQVLQFGKETYSPHCLAWAKATFSAESQMRRYLDLYQALLDG